MDGLRLHGQGNVFNSLSSVMTFLVVWYRLIRIWRRQRKKCSFVQSLVLLSANVAGMQKQAVFCFIFLCSVVSDLFSLHFDSISAQRRVKSSCKVFDIFVKSSCKVFIFVKSSCKVSDIFVKSSCKVSDIFVKSLCKVFDIFVKSSCKVSDIFLKSHVRCPIFL